MSERWEAPWTLEQVAALAKWQRDGRMHPYTCGNEHDADEVVLIPGVEGWFCPFSSCDYRQTWAYAIEETP